MCLSSIRYTMESSLSAVIQEMVYFCSNLYFAWDVACCSRISLSGKHICKWGLVLSSLFMLLEGWITYSLNLQKHNSMYLFLLPVMYFLFQLLLNISGRVPAWIRGGSMMLYIIHPAVIIVVRGIAKVTRLTKILVDNTFIQYILSVYYR